MARRLSAAEAWLPAVLSRAYDGRAFRRNGMQVAKNYASLLPGSGPTSLPLPAITLSTLHNIPALVRSGNRLVIHVAMLSQLYSIRNRIHSVTSSLSSPLQHTKIHMSRRLSLSILRMSTETRFIPRPPLFQMKRILNPKMTPFYPLLLVVLLEGLQNAESVVGMMKLIAQSVSSYVRGVGRAVDNLVRRVISQLMRQHDCFQVLGIHLT